ncbi:MAG: diheme cytochrome c [Candidatus Thiodiazotropha sp. (ex Codakia rugifera)]|nr:diheme cytochrome c [Candidatus Thiodiazotropha sp. (ex Codakia rugifera)]
MKVRLYWLFFLLASLTVLGAGVAMADRDDERGERFYSRWFKPDFMVYNNQESQRYQDECGSCHFPFQPGFLPAVSWQTMMTNLDDHFGENAELSEEDNARLLSYLSVNAADVVDREIPNKVMWSLRYVPSPQRITETAFFKHEHNEIPARILDGNGEKISFSNCDTCHTKAMQGSYEENEINIPGIGQWDD